MFDWQAFLTRYNIEYASAGRYHITMGNVGVQCPWCYNDTGFNLHISLDNKGWHCWKGDHRGYTPQRLIQALLKCPYSLADSLVNSSADTLPSDSDFIGRLTGLFQPKQEERIELTELKMPKTFEPIRPSGSGRMFCTYMEQRGFYHKDVIDLCNRFGLLKCSDNSRRWHGRIIFPVYINKQLMTWTGRHIGGSVIRYRTLSPSDPDTPAVCGIKKTVLWYDYLKKQRGTLVVCEGPFDALKVAYLGRERDIYATCLFSKSATSEQRDLLLALDNFDRKLLLMDSGVTDVFDPHSNFSLLMDAGFETKFLPIHISDPGDLNNETFGEIFC